VAAGRTPLAVPTLPLSQRQVSNFLESRLRSIFGTSSYNRLGDRVNALDEKRMSAAIKRGVSFSGGSPFGPAGRKTAFATLGPCDSLDVALDFDSLRCPGDR